MEHNDLRSAYRPSEVGHLTPFHSRNLILDLEFGCTRPFTKGPSLILGLKLGGDSY